MERRPIQLLAGVWNIGENEEVLATVASQVRKESLGASVTSRGRPLIRLALVETSEAKRSNIQSRTSSQLLDQGIELKIIDYETTCSAVGTVLEADAQAALQSGLEGIGTAREVCTIVAAASMDLTDDPIIWFLDDDLHFKQLGLNADGSLRFVNQQNLFQEAWSFHERHPSVVASFGGVTGCPPLPASSTMLSNMIDFGASLTGERDVVHDVSRWDIPDYYYDLSENPDRQEVIFPPCMWNDGTDILDAIFCHGTLFRPVVLTDIANSAAEQRRIVRGGNSLIYDLRAFFRNPYPTLELNGIRSRRGDSVWACLSQFIDGGETLSHNMRLHHGRNSIGWDANQASQFTDRMLADLYGAAFHRAIESSHERGEFISVNSLLDLAQDMRLKLNERAERQVEILRSSASLASEMVSVDPSHAELREEVESICEVSLSVLQELPGEDELHAALVDCWSRTTMWRDEIAPRLMELAGC